MNNDDFAYYSRRLAEEVEHARNARCPQARELHFQLAELYFDRLERLARPAERAAPNVLVRSG